MLILGNEKMAEGEGSGGRISPFRGRGGRVRLARCRALGAGPLIERMAGVRPVRREQVFMPLKLICMLTENADNGLARGKDGANPLGSP